MYGFFEDNNKYLKVNAVIVYPSVGQYHIFFSGLSLHHTVQTEKSWIQMVNLTVSALIQKPNPPSVLQL